MSRKLAYLCICVLLLGVSCAPTYLIKNLPKIELQNMNVNILPFYKCQVSYQGNVENEFGNGNPEILIKNHLQKGILNSLKAKSCFKNVYFCKIDPERNLVIDSVIYKGDKVIFMRPTQTSVSCISDIYLSIYNVKVFSTTIVNIVYFIPIITRKLSFVCDFNYWDSKSNEILSWGKVKKDSESPAPILTISNWDELIGDISDELLVNEAYMK